MTTLLIKPFNIFLFLFITSLVTSTATATTTGASPLGHNSSSPSQPSTSATCKYSLYPKLCRSILSSIKHSPSSPADPYTYSKFSIKQCLKQARKMTSSADRFLQHYRSSIGQREAGAMEDCRQLFALNVVFLESISEDLRSTELPSSEELVQQVRSRLSAIVTNQETCYEGLVEAKSGVLLRRSVGNGTVVVLSEPVIFDVSKLYSVSLGLVTHALSRNAKHRRRQKGPDGRFPPHEANPRREPLAQLIKSLQKQSRNNKCRSSSFRTSCRRKSERIVLEMEGNGIMVNDSVIVSKDGTKDFTTIGEAIAAAPKNLKPEDGYFIIYATQGYYQENIVVPSCKKNIMLLGDGINSTVVSANRSVVDGWTTYNSSTFAVAGDHFIGLDMTFKNTAGPEKHQAVAVRNQADLSIFYRCSIEGYQDTLYVHSLRQFYRDCHIYGTVDFIFGNAAAVFQNCIILARRPMSHQRNVITAQGRNDPNQNTGISIHNCTIEAAPDLAVDDSNYTTLSYLGRPWKEYSRTVYMQSYIGSLVTLVGWLEWNGTFGLDTLFYGEFENYGPGSNTGMRVDWPGFVLMNNTEALNFTLNNFIMGETWLPDTDIPFSEGLLEYN
ncbi:pectinesterase-like [Humulus lupulus]|uniref:pectinesterase-like n=1 Tax=Humulus lupulus TaxID=3486 RepID=UPI002B40A25E|nr:pectinesterase-like [Humulus lupulus]